MLRLPTACYYNTGNLENQYQNKNIFDFLEKFFKKGVDF
jgi:hypothetical protein